MTETQDPSRRVVVRGFVVFGLVGATGPLGGCGNDSTTAGAAPDPVTPSPAPPRTIRPGASAPPTSKSDLYRRGPEPRPSRTPSPVPAEPDVPPATVAPSEPDPGARPGDNLATARQREASPTSRPAPAPLPPGAFARTSEIPVGGGKTFSDQKIVVTQPTAGQFKGFSATCTHAGCLVDRVERGQIICPCHGSRFSITDGQAEQGPALLSLPAEKIAVSSDGAISRA
jgi:Rieske Fe-S protein